MKGASHVLTKTGQCPSMTVPCARSAQSVLSSSKTPFLTAFLGESLSCMCVFVQMCECAIVNKDQAGLACGQVKCLGAGEGIVYVSGESTGGVGYWRDKGIKATTAEAETPVCVFLGKRLLGRVRIQGRLLDGLYI